MKKIALFLALTSIGSISYAESVYDLAQAKCKTAETVAATAQTYRQLNMKPSEATEKLMSVTAKFPDSKNMNNKMVFMIVEDAYLVSVFPTKQMKEKAVSDFSERHYLACINSFSKMINSTE